MDTQLLDAIRTIMKQEIKTLELKIEGRLDKQDKKLDAMDRKIDYSFHEQNTKLNIILEGWQIQKTHREELNNHEERITAIEHRIPLIR